MNEGLSSFRPNNTQPGPQSAEILRGVEMLEGLVDTSGQQVLLPIESLLFNPAYNRLVITGPPGGGKTHVLYQVAYYLSILAQEHGIPFEISIILYDSWMRSARRRGEVPDSPQFNQTLAESIEHPKRWTKVHTNAGYSPKRVVLAEIPAVGYTQPKDRGVTAFEKLARDTDDTLFVHIVPHPLSQISGLAARFTASIVPEENVVRVLAKEHNMIIEAEGIDDEKVLGRKIKNAIRWTAKGPSVRTILYEMGHQFSRWRHLDREAARVETEKVILPESYNPSKISESLMREPTNFIDPEGYLFHSFVRKKAIVRSLLPRIEAAYAGYRFRQLGISEDHYIVAFNPYTTGPIHLHITA